jgi:hypothetical protein
MLMMLVCLYFYYLAVLPYPFACLGVAIYRVKLCPGVYEKWCTSRAARCTERGRDRIAMKSNLLRVHLCAREVIWCSIFPLDNLSYVIVMVRELS